MKPLPTRTRCLSAFLALFLALLSAAATASANRRMAVTIDDLPIAGAVRKDDQASEQITANLLTALTDRNIPAMGFVNESKLVVAGELEDVRVGWLKQWLTAGMGLGNHSYSHPDLHRTPLAEFQDDVLRGEIVTRRLLEDSQRQLRYFRHPYLHTGTSIDTKNTFERFLDEHGYEVAPVTIDNSEWIFAWAYDLSLEEANADVAAQIGADYVDYMMNVVDYYEKQSSALFDRNIDHVLLIHANELNADWFATLADRLDERGYQFISLDEALKDSAYRSEDRYVGRGGITWLHRWAITRNVDPVLFRGEPEVPAYILKLTGQD